MYKKKKRSDVRLFFLLLASSSFSASASCLLLFALLHWKRSERKRDESDYCTAFIHVVRSTKGRGRESDRSAFTTVQLEFSTKQRNVCFIFNIF